MKLQQLRYLTAIAKHNLNISAAAESLYTSQPGVSKQLRLLEEELGVELFSRHGKHLSQVTPIGRLIIDRAESILQEVANIRILVEEFHDEERGKLVIATTYTQARYALPQVVEKFRQRYLGVTLHIHQGSPGHIAELVASGEADFAIATETLELFEDLIMIPCYRWHRAILTPRGHPLAQSSSLTLQEIADHPLVTYVFGFHHHSPMDIAFRKAGLKPNVVFTATDADIIKTYVRLGMGVGIIARMAYDPVSDEDLACLDASHLFAANVIKIGFRRGLFLRRYMYEFIKLFAPHLTTDVVKSVSDAPSDQEMETILNNLILPVL